MGTEAPVVLIVEDDALVSEYLGRALGSHGFRVISASTGAEALRAAAEMPLAAALIDGLLPDVHGVDLARLLLDGDGSTLPMCLISGAMNLDLAPRSGFAALTKPTRPVTLSTTMDALLAWSAAGGSAPAARDSALDELAAAFSVQP